MTRSAPEITQHELKQMQEEREMAKKLVAVLTGPSPYYNLLIRQIDQNIYGITDEDVLATTDEDVEQFARIQREMDDKNALLYSSRLEAYNKAYATLKDVYKGDGATWTKVSKYLEKNKPQADFQRDVRLRSFLDRRKKLMYKQIKEAFEKRQEQVQADLLAKAIAFLLERGGVLGKTFSAEDAVDKAEAIYYAERMKQQEEIDDVVDFDQCDYCSSWHTQSNRCSCGNRRVAWAMSEGFSFSNPEGSYFRPEAW